jgi:ferredoxin
MITEENQNKENVPNPQKDAITIHFISPSNPEESQSVSVELNQRYTLLDVARQNNINIEAACEGSLACSTCQVYIDPLWYPQIPAAEVDEEDLLEMAFALKDTSRLSCQIEITKELDGLKVTVPEQTRHLKLDIN